MADTYRPRYERDYLEEEHEPRRDRQLSRPQHSLPARYRSRHQNLRAYDYEDPDDTSPSEGEPRRKRSKVQKSDLHVKTDRYGNDYSYESDNGDQGPRHYRQKPNKHVLRKGFKHHHMTLDDDSDDFNSEEHEPHDNCQKSNKHVLRKGSKHHHMTSDGDEDDFIDEESDGSGK